MIVTSPRPQSTDNTVLLNDPDATVSVIVRFVASAAMLEGTVAVPVVTQAPEVPCWMVKSLAAILPVVSVVPEGKVSLIVLEAASAVAGAKIVKLLREAPTYVPTVLPDAP